jgi:hypothetical protein
MAKCKVRMWTRVSGTMISNLSENAMLSEHQAVLASIKSCRVTWESLRSQKLFPADGKGVGSLGKRDTWSLTQALWEIFEPRLSCLLWSNFVI